MQAPPQARAVLGQFLVGNEEVGYRIGVPSVWPTGSTTSITNLVVTGDGHVTGGTLLSGQFGSLTFLTIYNQTVAVGPVSSAQSFGTVKLALRFGPGSVPSAQAFGVPTIKTAVTRSVGSVNSAQAFGAVTPYSVIRTSVTGIPSAQAFGTIRTAQGRPVGGVSTAQAFGVPTIKAVVNLAISGVTSAQGFGAVTPKAVYRITAVGLASAQAFGSLIFRTGFTQVVPGCPSAQAFGTIRTAFSVRVGGVPSAQQFGTSRFNQRLLLAGVPSAQAFGKPEVYVAWIEEIGCTDLVLPDLPACVQAQEAITGTPICGDGHVCGGISVNYDLPCYDTWPGAEGGTHGAILNEFLVGDGTLVGQTESTIGSEGGYFLETLPSFEQDLEAPPAEDLDLDPLVCV